jgi:hypothetical protein
VYAPKVYKVYYRGKNTAKEMLMDMDKVHQVVTERIPDARPPRFEYEEQGDKVLIMKYKSSRDMLIFLMGLIKGVGNHFNEKLTISKAGPDKVKVIFP